MSVNFTVNGKFSKHCGKSSLLEDPERKKKEQLEERKKQRLLQVRAESKNIAQKIRTDVAQQRERLQREFNKKCAQEQERLQRQAIAQAHHDYRCAIFQVGNAHRAACIENARNPTTSAAAAAATTKKQTYKEFKMQQCENQKFPPSNWNYDEKQRSCFQTAQTTAPSATGELQTAKISMEQTRPHCNCCPCNDMNYDNNESVFLEDCCELSSSDDEPKCHNITVIPGPNIKCTQTKATKLSKTPAVILDLDVGENDVVEILQPTEIKDSHTENNRQFSHIIRVSPEKKQKSDKTSKTSKPPLQPTTMATNRETTESSKRQVVPTKKKPRFTQISELIEKKSQSALVEKPTKKSRAVALNSPSKQIPSAPPPTPHDALSPKRPPSPSKSQAASKSPPRVPKPIPPASSSSPTRKLTTTTKSSGPSSPTQKSAPKSLSSSSPIRKSAPKSPSSSPIRKTLQKASSSSSPARKQAPPKSPTAAKSPSSSKSKKNKTNKNADILSTKSADSLSLQKPGSTATIATDSSQKSSSERVQFYDYKNKYTNVYPQPTTAVHIHIPPQGKSELNAMDQARIERELQYAREQEIERLKKKSEERGQKALEREQVRRDCMELTEKLDALTKQHAQAMPADTNMAFPVGTAQKEAKMNTAIEEILMRPAIITCPEIKRPIVPDPCRIPASCRTQQPTAPHMDPYSLNLGGPSTSNDINNSTPSSESCCSILLGYVNDQSKQVKKDLNQYQTNPQQNQEKTKRLKCLLKRINKLRDALLCELQDSGKQGESENIQQMIDSLCNLRQERENIIIDDIAKSTDTVPSSKQSSKEMLKQKDTELSSKQSSKEMLKQKEFNLDANQQKARNENEKEESTNGKLEKREKILQEKEAILEKKVREFFELQKNCNEVKAKQQTIIDADANADTVSQTATVMVGEKPVEIIVNVKCDTGTNSKSKTPKTARSPRKESKIIQSPNAIKKKKSNTNAAKQKQKTINRLNSFDSQSTSYRSLPPKLTTTLFNNKPNEPKEQPEPRKETSGPTAGNINPLLAQYIQRLLVMSRSSINALCVSTSDIETPSQSVVDITANRTDTSDSEGVSSERLERVQKFIADNRSFVNELENSITAEKNACFEKCIKNTLDKIWKQRFCENVQHNKERDLVPLGFDDNSKHPYSEEAEFSGKRKETTRGQNTKKQAQLNNDTNMERPQKTSDSQIQRTNCDARKKQIQDLCQKLINAAQGDCYAAEKAQKFTDTQSKERYCEMKREELAKQIAAFFQNLIDPSCEDSQKPNEIKTPEIPQRSSLLQTLITTKLTESYRISGESLDKSLKVQPMPIEPQSRNLQGSEKTSKAQKSDDKISPDVIVIDDSINDTDKAVEKRKSTEEEVPDIYNNSNKPVSEPFFSGKGYSFLQKTEENKSGNDSIIQSNAKRFSGIQRSGIVDTSSSLEKRTSITPPQKNSRDLLQTSSTKTQSEQSVGTNVQKDSNSELPAPARTSTAAEQSGAKRFSGMQISGVVDKSSSLEKRPSITPPQRNSRDVLQTASTKTHPEQSVSTNVQKDSNSELPAPARTSTAAEQSGAKRFSGMQISGVVDKSSSLEKRPSITPPQRNSRDILQTASTKTQSEQSVGTNVQKDSNSELPAPSRTSVTAEQQTSTDCSSLAAGDSQIHRYAQLTENCNQRIAELTDLINKVREEKQKILESTLSSVSDRERGSTEYYELPEPSERQVLDSDQNQPLINEKEKLAETPPASSAEASHAENMPLVKNKPTSGSRDSGISLSRPVTAQGLHSDAEPHSTASSKAGKKSKPPPILNRYSPQLLEAEVAHELSTIIEVDTPGTSRTAAAMAAGTSNAQKTAGCASSLSPCPTLEEYAKMVNLDITKIDSKERTRLLKDYKSFLETLVENRIKDAGIQKQLTYPTFEEFAKQLNLDIKAMDPNECARLRIKYNSFVNALNTAQAEKTKLYPTFEEYAKQLNFDVKAMDPNECARLQKEYNSFVNALNAAQTEKVDFQAFPTFEEYVKQLNLDLTTLDLNQTILVRKEYKELYETHVKEQIVCGAAPVVLPTFEEYAKILNLDLNQLDPNKCKCLREEYKSFIKALNEAKVTKVAVQLFPTYEEYAKQLNLDLTVMDSEENLRLREEYNCFIDALNKAKAVKLAIQSFPAFEEYASKLNLNLTLMDPNETLLAMEQHRDLLGAYIKAKTKNGCILPSPYLTFEEYARKMSLDLSQMDQKQVAIIEKEYDDFISAIDNAKSPIPFEDFPSFNAFVQQNRNLEEDCLLPLSDVSPSTIDNLIESLQLISAREKSKKKIAHNNSPHDAESVENETDTCSSEDTDSESLAHVEKELQRRNILRSSFTVPIERDNVFSSTTHGDKHNSITFQRMLLAESGIERISTTSDSRSGDFEKELLNVGINLPALMRKKRKEIEALSCSSTSTSANANIPSIEITYAESRKRREKSPKRQQQQKPHISDDSSDGGGGGGGSAAGANKLNLRDFLTRELQKHASSSSSSCTTGTSVDEMLKREFFQSIIGSMTTPSTDSPHACTRKTKDRQKTSTPISSNASDPQNASTSSQLFSGESRLSSVRFQKQTTTHYYPKNKESDISVHDEDKYCKTSTRYIPKPRTDSNKNLHDYDDDNDDEVDDGGGGNTNNKNVAYNSKRS